MSNNFMDMLNNTLTNSSANLRRTENGALGYRSTGKKLLDLNFSVSSMRKMGEAEIQSRFLSACSEGVDIAITWLFFARDVRGGMGERKLFRVCMEALTREQPEKVRAVLHLIAEYGRWDDLLCLMNTSVKKDVIKIVVDQLTDDMKRAEQGMPISLLAKWMPSENASSANTKRMARMFIDALKITPPQYRRMLSGLRKKIGVVECKMSANEWEDINYSAVPSRANLIYKDAFLKHDKDRRMAFLGMVEKGDAKINAATLFPHDIVHKYTENHSWYNRDIETDNTIEALWAALPNYLPEEEGTIVVADGSGSMEIPVDPHSGVKALDVANALAIYFAERLNGPYHNRYITFSSNPQLVNLNGYKTLAGKLQEAYRHCEIASTNIQAVFELILETAVKNKLEQNQMPKNILIISDMEFNTATGYHYVDETLFESIGRKFNAKGYQMPRLVFWNVNSRTGTIPVKQNDAGVALVSGFSPAIAKMVLSGKTDPYEALIETLNGERYMPVREALKSVKE